MPDRFTALYSIATSSDSFWPSCLRTLRNLGEFNSAWLLPDICPSPSGVGTVSRQGDQRPCSKRRFRFLLRRTSKWESDSSSGGGDLRVNRICSFVLRRFSPTHATAQGSAHLSAHWHAAVRGGILDPRRTICVFGHGFQLQDLVLTASESNSSRKVHGIGPCQSNSLRIVAWQTT